MPKARKVPPRTCGIAVVITSKPTPTVLPTIAAVSWPLPPLNGTWFMVVPVANRSSAIASYWLEPTPPLP
jgi:hypothetical protein